jgi:PAS domain-containing protein
VIQSRRPLVVSSWAEALALGVLPSPGDLETLQAELQGHAPTQPSIGVPMITGDEVIGVVSVRLKRDVADPDVSLLSTLAASLAVSLANARLFHEIQRQKEFSEALIAASPVAIAQTRLDSIVSAWNPAAERLFGYSASEAIGRHLDDLMANQPEIRQEADRYTAAAHQALSSTLLVVAPARTRSSSTSSSLPSQSMSMARRSAGW